MGRVHGVKVVYGRSSRMCGPWQWYDSGDQLATHRISWRRLLAQGEAQPRLPALARFARLLSEVW